MTAPRYVSIDLEHAFPLRMHYRPSVQLFWKGNHVSTFLLDHLEKLGIQKLGAMHLGKQVKSQVIRVDAEWRDGAKLSHSGMLLDSLAPQVVDTALAMLCSTAFRERSVLGEVIHAGEHFTLEFHDGTPDYNLKLHDASPDIFIGELVGILPLTNGKLKGAVYGDAVFMGAAPPGLAPAGHAKRGPFRTQDLVTTGDIRLEWDETQVFKL